MNINKHVYCVLLLCTERPKCVSLIVMLVLFWFLTKKIYAIKKRMELIANGMRRKLFLRYILSFFLKECACKMSPLDKQGASEKS